MDIIEIILSAIVLTAYSTLVISNFMTAFLLQSWSTTIDLPIVVRPEAVPVGRWTANKTLDSSRPFFQRRGGQVSHR